MNLIPVAVTAAVVAAVPPLRRRVLPVAGAVANAGVRTAATALVGGAAVVSTAFHGAGEVVGAAVHTPGDGQA